MGITKFNFPLPPKEFFRVHRSTIVEILKIANSKVRMKDDTIHNISRSNWKVLTVHLYKGGHGFEARSDRKNALTLNELGHFSLMA